MKTLFYDKDQKNIRKTYILDSKDNWSEYLDKFPSSDTYYSREYVTSFAVIENGVPEAIYYEEEQGKVFYPFIKRKIEIKKGYFDTVTPYGYGGPIVEGNINIIKPFYSEFKKYCMNNKIITETVRLHPLLKNEDYIKECMEVEFIRKTIAIDLTPPLEEIRSRYTPTNRRNIRKAKKEGVSVFVSDKKNDIEIFMDLYYETMERNQAGSFYYFDRDYFYRQMEETKLCHPFFLFAKYNGQIIGGVLVLIGKEFAHYHLGGSKTNFLSLRPNNLLFDTMVEFAKFFNLKFLHLGGGYAENDSLFKFKASFTSNGLFNFYLGKNIIDPNIYNELNQQVLNNLSVSCQNNFFPCYRRKY